jgi:hypothetical protein
MAVNVNEVYKFVQFISNKSQSGNLTPDNFNTSLKRALYEFVMNRLGNIFQYQPGQPVQRISFQSSKRVSDDLRHLITPVNPAHVDIDGQFPIPADYLFCTSIRYKYKTLSDDGKNTEYVERKVDLVTDAEVSSISDSEIFKARLKAGKMCFAAEYGDYFQFYPSNVGTVIFTYLRMPETPMWAFTVVNNRPVYDPANSVDVDIQEISTSEVVMNVCNFLGINLRENDLIQYSELKKQEGV